ncbi:MAG: 3-dehydroquinate synthase [Bacteroidaceae bacterium]|nr:3-dehydroquinate synthase [Bacteroidaceae bacterium]
MLDLEKFDKIFILCDENTEKLCLPKLLDELNVIEPYVIVVPAGDIHKDIESLQRVWTGLIDGKATRYSLLINLGGGMVTDLGGFAASTFKRGIKFMNYPTTLLGMVDASAGGKTGINFGGLKNEIGLISMPTRVIFKNEFLRTLDRENLLSGYAEMLKHGLLSKSDMIDELLAFDLYEIDFEKLGRMIRRSVGVKKVFVEKDVFEKDMRKALNFGHTLGHAFESLAMKKGMPILHGYAVAWGMICELYLSAAYFDFPQDTMRRVVQFIREHYGTMNFSCDDYDQLYEYISHDKKNIGEIIQCTLLSGLGVIRINRPISKEQMFEALDFLREGM